jgi:hypothetical protein
MTVVALVFFALVFFALVFFPLVLLYQGWSLYVFRHRISTPTVGVGPSTGGDPQASAPSAGRSLDYIPLTSPITLP